MNPFIKNTILIIGAATVLVMIAGQAISDHQIPSFSEYMASTTARFASSTDLFASSTSALSGASAQQSTSTLPIVSFKTSAGSFHAYLAATEASREQGLSGRASLPTRTAMLFAFDIPSAHGFWMKDMLFSLDMVWIAADRTVVSIDQNVSPDTFPKVFPSPGPIKYVIEIPAGSAKSFGLVQGAKVDFDLP